MSIRQLIYLSTATGNLGTNELSAILDDARRRNAQDEITGMLVYDDRSFLQVLEGPAAAVERARRRIEGDGRHAGMCIVSDLTRERRDFGEWAMAFCGAAELAKPGAIDLFQKRFATLLPEHATAEVHAFLTAFNGSRFRFGRI